jgi:hypothetical protein
MGRFLRSGTAALMIVFATAAILRLAVVAARQSLWADELFSLAMATGHSLEHPAEAADPARGDFVESAWPEPPSYYSRYLDHERPPADMSRVIRAVFLSDTSPPLYYVLLAAWTRLLGTSAGALRLFSVAASLASLVLVAGLAWRAGGRAAILPAAALFAASPMAVHYSTEGRMYALLWLWVAAILTLALELRIRGSRPALLAGYVAVGAAGLLTHYFYVPVFLVASAWLLVHPGRCGRSRLTLGLGLTALLVLPWYAQMPRSLAQWRVTGQWLKQMPYGYDAIFDPLGLPWTLLSINVAWGVPWFLDVLNGTVVLILLAVAVRRLGRRLLDPRRRLLWFAAAAGVGTPIFVDFALGTYMSAVPRYALAALPPTLVLVAVTLTALDPRRRAFVVSLLVVLALAGTWRVLRAWNRSGEPFASLGWFLGTNVRASDVVVVHSIPSGVCGVARYMLGKAAGLDAPLLASWVGPLRRREVPSDIEALADGRRRVLLVKIHTVYDLIPEEAWLRRQARLVSEMGFDNAWLLVFEPRDGGVFAFSGGRTPSLPRASPTPALDYQNGRAEERSSAGPASR